MRQLAIRENKRPGLWIGLSFLASVLTVMAYGLYQLNAWLEDEQRLPVKKIRVSGDFKYISEQDVDRVVRANQPGSFFQLDVKKARADIEALPWVYRASVRKDWPNNLHVHLVEQVAVARWNQDMLLNNRAESFMARVPQGLELPDLFGPQGSEEAALDGYRAMLALLQQSGFGITELVLTERFAWHVELSNELELNLGRSEFIDKLQRFVDIYPLLMQGEREPEYVDLRYDTGLAVGWKQADEQQS
ncbi:cell division protein FtsQ/DivIB [Lacimicrobium alkaliphilum]|uniref:Cell division protein FtsQ n=1 Tax=Lacimicrobium alkaliphilum TaxID=1526571 RepID=A0ABQ1QYB3_9ALTE|nr:cell division protein FtsQ/DivIB [Lacimicrobium alkaliphilum]GGD50915.1 cell division protein FtsQ [Lacimicrobium alkaliphilum]